MDTCRVGVVGGVLETAANTPRSVAIAAVNCLPPSDMTLLQIVATANTAGERKWPHENTSCVIAIISTSA